MIAIKEFIKYNNVNCIEVTWVENNEIIHCQAYSDVQIDMLRADAKKYNTPLDEYEHIIKEVESNIVYPTPEEIAEQEIKTKLQEAQYLLDTTEFKFNDDYDLKNTPEWLELKAKRQEARQFIRDNK